jgi:uncharacterized SAM-binding protein YcdF (DUF218 family)
MIGAKRQDMAIEPASPAPARSSLRHVLRAAALIAVAGTIVLGAGFVWFVRHVPREEVVLDRNADGIVVLTGGASRVADAIELLAEGRGSRLLISGVHPSTNATQIARQHPRYERLVTERVDLDYAAVNTIGNAVGTRQWARERGFRSLIVVTSSYHMPRTMAELARQMPDITLIPFPVVTDKLRNERWWASGPTARLILSEYAKYVVALVRMRIEPPPDATGATRMGAKS